MADLESSENANAIIEQIENEPGQIDRLSEVYCLIRFIGFSVQLMKPDE